MILDKNVDYINKLVNVRKYTHTHTHTHKRERESISTEYALIIMCQLVGT